LSKKTASLIVNSGNDYLIGLKANQPTLYQLAVSLQKYAPISCATSFDDTHSRLVKRECKVFAVPENLSTNWLGLKTIIVVYRSGYRHGKPWDERQFYISSLIQPAELFLADIQGHWGIENRLHWVRDVTFTEDFPTRRGGQSPVNWAILHNFFITLARILRFRTIPQAQRALSNQLQQVFSLLSNQPPGYCT
jgi:predicted transposase YbfD/YdcC